MVLWPMVAACLLQRIILLPPWLLQEKVVTGRPADL